MTFNARGARKRTRCRLICRRIARHNDKSRNSTMKIIAKRLLQAYFDSVARMPYPAIWMA